MDLDAIIVIGPFFKGLLIKTFISSHFFKVRYNFFQRLVSTVLVVLYKTYDILHV